MAKYGYGNSTDAGSPYLASRGAEQIWQSMNTVRVPHVRLVSDLNPIDSEPEYIWQDDAACAYLPPSMFELADSDSQIAEGMAEAEIKDLNSTNFEAAKKACAKCPVWHLCYQEAKPSDFEHTVRAGLTPLRHNPTPPGRPVVIKAAQPAVRQKIDPSKPCKNGHSIEEWSPRSDKSSYYCKACKRGSSANARARIDTSKPCKNGHSIEEWRKKANQANSYYCRSCKREARQSREMTRNDPSKPCKNGHDLKHWSLETRKGRQSWRCLQCKRDQQNARWAELAAARLAS